MKESLRVSLSVSVWIALALGVLVVATYVVQREMNRPDEEQPQESLIDHVEPVEVGFDDSRLNAIANVVGYYIEKTYIRGAVVGVVHQGKLAYCEAFGGDDATALSQPMTIGATFAVTPLQGTIVTATAIMQLVEHGVIRLDDSVNEYISHTAEGVQHECEADIVDAGNIRIIELLTHLPYCHACDVVLTDIVESVTGIQLEEYAYNNIFLPLAMHNTRYVVNDVCQMELISTVEDMAVYAAMMLNGGEWCGARILSERGVETMLAVPRGFDGCSCALGWESYTGYSTPAGDLFTASAVGGADDAVGSIVLDAELDLAVIVFTCANTIFDISELSSRVATIVGSAVNVNR